MRIPVLMYHVVMPVDATERIRGRVTVAVFREQIAWLVPRGFRTHAR
jgi:hypothetical protein